MIVWGVSFGFFLVGLIYLTSPLAERFRKKQTERQALKRVVQVLVELEESLKAGWVPGQARWERIYELPFPWRQMIQQSVHELRAAGANLLPTLERLRELAEKQNEQLDQARAQTAYPLSQATLSFFLIPISSSFLYFLLPSVSRLPWAWIGLTLLAWMIALTGALWIGKLSGKAQRGNLKKQQKNWSLFSLCFGERFLALVRSGLPADLAWLRSYEWLESLDAQLGSYWEPNLLEKTSFSRTEHEDTARSLLPLIQNLAGSLQESVYISIMEGSSCLEKVETVLDAQQKKMERFIGEQLKLLGTKCLKPMFICLFPAMMILLVSGLYLEWYELSQKL